MEQRVVIRPTVLTHNPPPVPFSSVLTFSLCNERLKVKTDGSTRLTYTPLHRELEVSLEHLKIVRDGEIYFFRNKNKLDRFVSDT